MKTHMDALIHHFLIVAEGFDVPAGEVYHPIEASKGELGVYIKSDGGPKPARVHFRGPSFVNLSALPHDVPRARWSRTSSPSSARWTSCSGK